MKIYCTSRHGDSTEEILDWLINKDLWVSARLGADASASSIRILNKLQESEFQQPIYACYVIPYSNAWLSCPTLKPHPPLARGYMNCVRYFYLPHIHLELPLDYRTTAELFDTTG